MITSLSSCHPEGTPDLFGGDRRIPGSHCGPYFYNGTFRFVQDDTITMAKEGVKNKEKTKPALAKASVGKGELFLLLDVGTTFLKVGIAQLDLEKKRVFLLNYAQAPVPAGCFEKKFSFDPQALFAVANPLISQVQQIDNFKTERCLIAASSDYLAGQIFGFSFTRSQPKSKIDVTEIENIFIKIIHQIKEKIKSDLKNNLQKGMPHLIDARLLQLFVDGYLLKDPRGMTGEKLEGQIFNVYTLRSCWQKWQTFAALLQKKEVVFMPCFWSLITGLAEENSLIVDIGGNHTEVFLKKANLLTGQLSFGIGGAAFSQALADALGIGHQEAEEIKLKYIKKELSPQAKKRLDKIFEPVLQNWLKGLCVALKDIAPNVLLPEKIFLVGGGSLFINLVDSLKQMLSQGDLISKQRANDTEKAATPWCQGLAFLARERLLIKSLEIQDMVPLVDKTGQRIDAQKIVIGSLTKTALKLQSEQDGLESILKKAVKLAA